MNYLVPILIGSPILFAIILSFIKNGKVRGMVVYTGISVVIAEVITMLVLFVKHGKTYYLYKSPELVNHGMLVIEILLMFFIIFISAKYNKFVVSLLSIVQTGIIFWVEVFGPETEWEVSFMLIDRFTMLMCIIIAVVGGLICVYAVGYMHGFHQHHKEIKDRRPYFFFILFVFLSAMFGLVLSNNLLWMDFFWELTSISSFLLIGYTKTEEAINNSFRALWMNLLGGLAFAIAIVYLAVKYHFLDLSTLVAMRIIVNENNYLFIPMALLAFAGLTKSAQLPFSGWLLGAMVAPTPSSALLHSATMVKAGVYLLLRLGPGMADTKVGTMVSFIGGFTFLMASMLAISQSDAKKVLAYSTVSNLGLITACAGAGKAETLWAGVFLLIFHAVSKSMLFQDVGAVENAMGSRDIEDMDNLILKLPRLACIMMIGIAGMFLAPFGMLTSKWAALKAFVNSTNTMLVLFIAFGSATTMFYWMKWFGKLLGLRESKPILDKTKNNEWVSLFFHAVLMIGLCLSFPLLSKKVVEPMLPDLMIIGSTSVLQKGNFYVMIIMLVAVFVVPTIMYFSSKKVNQTKTISYMAGANMGDNINFRNSFGGQTELNMSNWYMENLFGEKRLLVPSLIISSAFLIVMLCVIVGGAV